MWHEWKRSVKSASSGQDAAARTQFNRTRLLWAGGKHKITCLIIHGSKYARRTIHVNHLRDVVPTLKRTLRKTKYRAWGFPRTVKWLNGKGRAIARLPRAKHGQRVYALLTLGSGKRRGAQRQQKIVIGTWGIKKKKNIPQFVESPPSLATRPTKIPSTTPVQTESEAPAAVLTFTIADHPALAWLQAPDADTAITWRATLPAELVIPANMTNVHAARGWQLHRGAAWQDVMGARASYAAGIKTVQEQVHPSLELDSEGMKAMQTFVSAVADSILRLACLLRLDKQELKDVDHDLPLELLHDTIVPKIFKGDLGKHAVVEAQKVMLKERAPQFSLEDVHASVEACTGLVASESFSIFLAGVLEYLVAEVLELAGNAARDGEGHLEWTCATRLIGADADVEAQRRACERGEEECTFSPHLGETPSQGACEPSSSALDSVTEPSDMVQARHVALGIQGDEELKDLADKTSQTEAPIVVGSVACPATHCVGVLLPPSGAPGDDGGEGAEARRRMRTEFSRVLAALGGPDGGSVHILRVDTVRHAVMARFHNIAEIINPGYEHYVTPDKEEGMDARISEYIRSNKVQDGDILFVGSTYESRQEYGFSLVYQNGRHTGGEEVYGRGYRGIVDMARFHDVPAHIDYSQALAQVKQFCQQSGIGCDRDHE